MSSTDYCTTLTAMPEICLQPVRTLLTGLYRDISEFLLTHRLPLMEKPDPKSLKVDIASELAELFREGTGSDRHFLCAIHVAEQETPVGHLWYRLQDEVRGLGAAFLLWIQIDAPYRCKGYATAAMKTLLNDLRRQGIASFGLESYADNLPARRLYDRLGLEVVREVRWHRLALKQENK